MNEMWSDLKDHPEHGLFLLAFIVTPLFCLGACVVQLAMQP